MGGPTRLKLVNYGRAHPKKKTKNSTLDCRLELQSRVDSSRTDETNLGFEDWNY